MVSRSVRVKIRGNLIIMSMIRVSKHDGNDKNASISFSYQNKV